MENQFTLDMILPALPEIFLAGAVLVLLMVGVFSNPERASRNVAGLAAVALVITFIMLLAYAVGHDTEYAFPYGGSFGAAIGHMFVADFYAFYGKTLILLTSFLAIGLAAEPLQRMKINNFEFYILLLLATVGMMIMASAHHLLSLYMGLELMSFSLYILAAFNRNNAQSSEAGLKYFVMGSIASGVLLFGLSYIYGIAGDLSFATIGAELSAMDGASTNFPLILGLVFVLTAMAFKLSAVPFHMWTPDVYQGAPTPVTAFMAAGPKIAAFVVLLRLLAEPFAAMAAEWSQIIAALAVLTMAVGAYMAIVQTNIKRLLAYSAIGHVGFMLVGTVAGTEQGIQAVLMYLTIYSIMTLGAFGIMLLLRRKDVYLETFEDLSGLSQRAPGYAFMFMLLLFSIAGIPPLAGFFAKFYVFSAAVDAGYTWLAVLGLLFSVVAAYYVLRLVRVMYFDEPLPGKVDQEASFSLRAVVVVTVLFTVGYVFLLNPLNTITMKAASSLEVTKTEQLHDASRS